MSGEMNNLGEFEPWSRSAVGPVNEDDAAADSTENERYKEDISIMYLLLGILLMELDTSLPERFVTATGLRNEPCWVEYL